MAQSVEALKRPERHRKVLSHCILGALINRRPRYEPSSTMSCSPTGTQSRKPRLSSRDGAKGTVSLWKATKTFPGPRAHSATPHPANRCVGSSLRGNVLLTLPPTRNRLELLILEGKPLHCGGRCDAERTENWRLPRRTDSLLMTLRPRASGGLETL